MKDNIKKVLKKYGDCQMNLSSSIAREILAEEINKEFEQLIEKYEEEIAFQTRLLNNVHKITSKYPEIKKVISGELVE